MKKLAGTMLLLLAIPMILSGCTDGGEGKSGSGTADLSSTTEYTGSEGDVVTVDPSKVVTTESDISGFRYEGAEYASPFVPSTKEVYLIRETQSYEDHWFLTYEAYYPKFTDEISDEAVALTLQEFYQEGVDNAYKQKEKFFETYGFATKTELTDQASELNHYFYQDYSTEFIGDYLSVQYDSYLFIGGSRGLHDEWADNFDLRSARVLSLEDVVGTMDEAALVLNPLFNEALKEKYPTFYHEVDVKALQDMDGNPTNLSWALTSDGLKLIMTPGAYAPQGEGPIFVTIPYDSLQPILKLDGALS